MAVREARRAGRRGAHLALFDATTLVAKGVKEHLLARSFPVASVRLFTSRSDPDSNLSEFGGEAMLVTAPDIDALGSLDIAFLCGTPREGAAYLDWPRRKGFVAIDLTSASNASDAVPLVNAAVNPETIATAPGLIAAPHPVSQLLSSLLAPVLGGPGLLEATAVVFQPASGAGDEGIEELHQQTAGLLGFNEAPREVFGRQLAFNLIPASLYADGRIPGGGRPGDLAREVQRVTGGSYRLGLEVILAPVFHGHAVLAHLILPPGTGRGDLLAAFDGSDEVRPVGPGEASTPAERAGEAGIALAGCWPAREGSAFWLWAVSDHLKGGTPLNAVRIAEALVGRGLGRSDA
jgi:aspartate-semialdehyde dehydrogenase